VKTCGFEPKCILPWFVPAASVLCFLLGSFGGGQQRQIMSLGCRGCVGPKDVLAWFVSAI
jgi:hypothetical protein